MSDQVGIRVLLLLVAVLAGVIVALVAGILTRAGGAAMNAVILRGGVAFAGTVTLFLVAMNSISAL